MLRGGITCFNDMYFFPEAAAQAASEFGMRAMLGMTTLEFPPTMPATPKTTCARAWPPATAPATPHIHFALAPHAPCTVSDHSFAHIATLAEQLNLPFAAMIMKPVPKSNSRSPNTARAHWPDCIAWA